MDLVKQLLSSHPKVGQPWSSQAVSLRQAADGKNRAQTDMDFGLLHGHGRGSAESTCKRSSCMPLGLKISKVTADDCLRRLAYRLN